VRLYSKIALGACFDIFNNYEVKDDKVNKKSKTNVDFAYQVSALGVEVGQSVCGFAELGFGYQGVIQAGVKFRF
jgi:hypothetical protein